MKKTQGVTFIGMMLIIACLVILGLLAMRVTPVYLKHYSVTHALKSIQNSNSQALSSEPASNATLIKSNLLKQFEIDDIPEITESNITVKPIENQKMLVNIHYQVVRPFLGNISLLFDFNNSQEVTVERESE